MLKRKKESFERLRSCTCPWSLANSLSPLKMGRQLAGKFKQAVLDRSMVYHCTVVLSTTYYVALINVHMRCTIT